MQEKVTVKSLPWRLTIESKSPYDFEDTWIFYKLFICILNILIFITVVLAVILHNPWLFIVLLFITKYKGSYDSDSETGRFECVVWWLTYKLFTK